MIEIEKPRIDCEQLAEDCLLYTSKAGALCARFFADFAVFCRQRHFYCVLTGTKAESLIKICTLLLVRTFKNML